MEEKVRIYVGLGLYAFAVGVFSYAFEDGEFRLNGAVIATLLLVILGTWVLKMDLPEKEEEDG